jgi:hypothetical protein
MISALARAAAALAEPRYAAQAARAAEFVLDRMRERGRLLRSYSEGRARHDAYLEDYAFVIAGLVDLYEADSSPRWLEQAMALDRVLGAPRTSPRAASLPAAATKRCWRGPNPPTTAPNRPATQSGPEPAPARLSATTPTAAARAHAAGCLRQPRPGPSAFSSCSPPVRLNTPKQVVIVAPSRRAQPSPARQLRNLHSQSRSRGAGRARHSPGAARAAARRQGRSRGESHRVRLRAPGASVHVRPRAAAALARSSRCRSPRLPSAARSPTSRERSPAGAASTRAARATTTATGRALSSALEASATPFPRRRSRARRTGWRHRSAGSSRPASRERATRSSPGQPLPARGTGASATIAAPARTATALAPIKPDGAWHIAERASLGSPVAWGVRRHLARATGASRRRSRPLRSRSGTRRGLLRREPGAQRHGRRGGRAGPGRCDVAAGP